MQKQYLDFLPLPHTGKPAMVVELKYGRSASAAVQQIKDRNYTQAFEDYTGEILLVGVNYDKENPDKPHSCVIEKVDKETVNLSELISNGHAKEGEYVQFDIDEIPVPMMPIPTGDSRFYYVKEYYAGNRMVDLTKIFVFAGLLFFVLALLYILPVLIKVNKGDFGNYDEKKMLQSLGKYIPEGETLAAGMPHYEEYSRAILARLGTSRVS